MNPSHQKMGLWSLFLGWTAQLQRLTRTSCFSISVVNDNKLRSACEEYMSDYGKCSEFLFLFSNKLLVFRAGIHKILVRIANGEDPDQTASSEAV